MNWLRLFTRRRRIIDRLTREVQIDGQECVDIEAAFRLMIRDELPYGDAQIERIAANRARRFTMHLARVRSERRRVA